MKLHSTTRVRKQPTCRDGHAIGLDLGATSVRATVLSLGHSDGRSSAVVSAVGSVPLPTGAIVNGVVTEQAVVVQALKKLKTVAGFNCNSVILGIANPQVVVRPLQIPNLTVQQRAQALPFQAREIIALPMDEVILDYAQIGEPDPQTNMVSGLLIATPRRPVLAAVEAVERAGLKVARVDLSSFGALRSIADEHLTVEAVIDVGAHLTSIVIHHHGVPQLVRTLARGGQELTDLLAETFDLEQEEAERLKFERGLTGQGDAVSDTLQAGLRPLLAEIRSSINYFRAGSNGARIEGISLTGGGAALAGFAAALSNQNDVPTTVVTPLHNLGGHAGAPGPTGPATAFADPSGPWPGTSAVAVGLAMGAAA